MVSITNAGSKWKVHQNTQVTSNLALWYHSKFTVLKAGWINAYNLHGVSQSACQPVWLFGLEVQICKWNHCNLAHSKGRQYQQHRNYYTVQPNLQNVLVWRSWKTSTQGILHHLGHVPHAVPEKKTVATYTAQGLGQQQHHSGITDWKLEQITCYLQNMWSWCLWLRISQEFPSRY